MKKVRSLCLLIALCLCLSCVASATSPSDENVTVEYSLYNPVTGECSPLYPEAIANTNETVEAHLDEPIESNSARMLVWNFVSYSHRTATTDYEYYQIAYTRLDNRNSTNPSNISLTLSNSGHVDATITSGVKVGGEVSAVVGKLKEEYSVSASVSVGWTSGQTVMASSSVSPGKVGYIYVYIPGIYADGTATYTVLDTSTDTVTTVTQGLGALVPDGNFSFKVVEKDS